jgi:signal peptide peptidase SppA
MKYRHILSAFAAEPWAVQKEKLEAITAFLMFKAAGGEYSSEEVAARISKKRDSEVAASSGSVAIIPIFGLLSQRVSMMEEISGGTSYESLQKSLDAAIANPDVKAIILDVDSPGGSVPGTDELAAEIRALRGGEKPIIAQVNSLAASAAYWIASSADEVVATPSARAGSIGVYTSHTDISKFLEKNGITRTYIAAGKYKVEGNETQPLSEETKDYIQALVDGSYDKFIAAVAEGRGVTKSRVLDSYGQGRIFGADDLLDRGMVDRIASMGETMARFGADPRPEQVRRIKAANASRASAAEDLAKKIRAGQPVTKREFENGLKGLVGCSNSEAERAARLYLKADQGEPDIAAERAVIDAIASLQASLDSFTLPEI